MANPMKGEASLRLADGRTLTLAYSFDALCAVEEVAARSISEVLAEISKGAPRLTTARALIYGGLQQHHPEVTLTEAGELILSDGPAVSEAMNRALAAAFPKAAEGRQAANPPSQRPGTGSRSSRSGRAKA